MRKLYIRNNLLLFIVLILISAGYSLISELELSMFYLISASLIITLFAIIINLIYFVPQLNSGLKLVLPGAIHAAVVMAVYFNDPEFKFFMIGAIAHLTIGVWTIVERNGRSVNE